MDDLEVVKAEAVSRLRRALLSREGVADALRSGFYQNPVFCFLLFIGAVRYRFGAGDAADITSFLARIESDRPGDPLGFPTAEAELIMRLSLGEQGLTRQIDTAAVNYPEIAITVLTRLFAEWQPVPDQVNELVGQTEEVERRTRKLNPQLAQADGLWFAAGMHHSPFSAPLDEEAPAHMQQQSDAEALARYDRLIADDPGNIAVLAQRADLLRAMGRFDDALAGYGRALDLDPDDHEALTGRAGTYLDMDRYDEAVADFSRALSRAPSPDWEAMDLQGRALTYRLMGRYEEALADYDEAIRLDGDSQPAVTGRADTCRLMGRLDEAVANYTRSIELDPADAWPVTNRARTYQAMGRYAEALTDYDRALDLDPTDYLAITGRGDSYRLTERYAQALEEYNRAVELYPDEAEAFAGRGLAHLARGELERAWADIGDAIERDPALAVTLGQYLEGEPGRGDGAADQPGQR